MNETEEITCVDCGRTFPEDMINIEDEPLCEECYIERGIARKEEYMDLD